MNTMYASLDVVLGLIDMFGSPPPGSIPGVQVWRNDEHRRRATRSIVDNHETDGMRQQAQIVLRDLVNSVELHHCPRLIFKYIRRSPSLLRSRLTEWRGVAFDICRLAASEAEIDSMLLEASQSVR